MNKEPRFEKIKKETNKNSIDYLEKEHDRYLKAYLELYQDDQEEINTFLKYQNEYLQVLSILHKTGLISIDDFALRFKAMKTAYMKASISAYANSRDKPKNYAFDYYTGGW